MNSSQKHRQDAMEKCGFPQKSVPLQSESQFCQYEEGDTPPRDEQGESIPDVDVVAPAVTLCHSILGGGTDCEMRIEVV